jgi:hypothetical protein
LGHGGLLAALAGADEYITADSKLNVDYTALPRPSDFEPRTV